jgi:hypothetical protein
VLEDVKDKMLENIYEDRAGREKSAKYLAYESNISYATALRVLRKHQLSNVKPTRKLGLNA